MRLPASVRVNSDVVSQRLGEEMVLLNLKTGVYWALNKTGAAIWREIEKQGDLQRIVAALHACYEVSEPQLSSAVRGILAQLLKEGLLVSDVPGC